MWVVATIPIVVRLVITNRDGLRKLSILMYLQDTVPGQPTQRPVIQVVQLTWNRLKLLKHKLLRHVNEEGVMRHVKYTFGFEMVVLLLPKVSLVKMKPFQVTQQALVLRRLMP